MGKRYASVTEKSCVACGACETICPKAAVTVWKGCYACVDIERCVGCGLCAKTCPAAAVAILAREVGA